MVSLQNRVASLCRVRHQLVVVQLLRAAATGCIQIGAVAVGFHGELGHGDVAGRIEFQDDGGIN